MCDFGDGAPAFGECDGPQERARVRRAELLITGDGCGIGEVAFMVDGGPLNEDTGRPACGECVPGRSGESDTLRSCRVDEYCDDSGTCRAAAGHPLFGEPCPFDVQVDDGYSSWCGSGLRCVRHACRQCDDGAVSDSGAVCELGVWTFGSHETSDEWEASAVLALAAIALLLVANFAATCLLMRRVAAAGTATAPASRATSKDRPPRARGGARSDDEGSSFCSDEDDEYTDATDDDDGGGGRAEDQPGQAPAAVVPPAPPVVPRSPPPPLPPRASEV